MDATPRAAPGPEGARGIPKPANSAYQSTRSERQSRSEYRPILFRRGEVEITPEWIAVRGYCYPVTELRDVRTQRGPRHPGAVRAAVWSAAVLTGLTSVLGLLDNPVRISGHTVVTLAAAVVVPLLLVIVGERLRPRRWQLWADFLGIDVKLFETTDRNQYGQVMRALQGAIEDARLGAAAGPQDLAPWLPGHRVAVHR